MKYLLVFFAVLQLVVLSLFWRRWGMKSFGRLGFYFIGMATLFHGVTEIIQFLLPDLNFYRTLIEDDASLLVWVVYATIANVFFCGSYIFVDKRLRRRVLCFPEVRGQGMRPDSASFIACIFLAVLGVLVFVLNSAGIATGYLAEGLVGQFLLMTVFTAGVVVVQSSGGRGYYFVLLMMLGFCFIIGQRSYLVAAGLSMIYSLYRLNYRVRFRAVFLMVGLVFMSTTAIIAVRSSFGREFFQGSYTDRRGAVSAGEGFGGQQSTRASLFEDIAYRIDGNSLASLIQQRQSNGYPMMGLVSFWSNVRLAVPSFLNPGKVQLDVREIEERGYIQSYYDVDYGIDFLLPLYGGMFSYYGVFSLVAGCLLFGAFYAFLDWRLHQSATVASTFIALGALFCVVLMEQGLRVYFTNFRGLVPLALLFLVIDRVSSQRTKSQLP